MKKVIIIGIVIVIIVVSALAYPVEFVNAIPVDSSTKHQWVKNLTDARSLLINVGHDNNSAQNPPQDTTPKPAAPSTQQPVPVKQQAIDCNYWSSSNEVPAEPDLNRLWHEQCDPVFLKASPSMKMYYRTGDPKYFNQTEYCIEVPLEITCHNYRVPSNQTNTNSDQPNVAFLRNHLLSIEGKLQKEISKDIIKYVNLERTNHGVRPIFNDDIIAQSALSNSIRVANEKLYITSQDYETTVKIAHATMTERLSSICNSYSENVAGISISGTTESDINDAVRTFGNIFVQKWIHSTHGHHENMINNLWTLTGVGVYLNPDTGIMYATQDFCDSLKPVQ